MKYLPNFITENLKVFKTFDKVDKVDTNPKEDKHTEPVGQSENDVAFSALGMEWYHDSIYASTSNKKKLLKEYREMAMYPEVSEALDEICDEAISPDDQDNIIKLQIDNEKVAKNQNKTKNLQKEFDYIMDDVLKVNDNMFTLFKKFYTEGELFGELVINENSPKAGVQKIAYLPADNMEVKYDKFGNVESYYQLVEKTGSNTDTKVLFKKSQIAYVNSGVFSNNKTMPLSYLERAKISYRQLKWMEDSLIIYRIVRAPERRVFTIDVGNLPKGKAEEYMNSIVKRYQQKKIYNPATGNIDVGKQVLSMIEDFWLPKRSDGSGPSVETLPGGESLGEITDVLYFVKKLYKALKVPTRRLEDDGNQFMPRGQENDITRDEIKFSKYVVRVRSRFSKFLLQIFITHLKLKGLWQQYQLTVNDITLLFNQENEWRETRKLTSLRERLELFGQMKEYENEVYSLDWLQRNILKMSDEEIKENQKGFAKEEEPEEGDEEAGLEDGEEEAPEDGEEEKPFLVQKVKDEKKVKEEGILED